MIFHQEFKDTGPLPTGDNPIPSQIILNNDVPDTENEDIENSPIQIETTLEGKAEDYHISGVEDNAVVQEMILKAAENVVLVSFISEFELENKPQRLKTSCTGILIGQLDLDWEERILLETVAHCIPPGKITDLYINGQRAKNAYTISPPIDSGNHRNFAKPGQDKAYIVYESDVKPDFSNIFSDLDFSNISPNDLLAMAHHYDISFFQIGFRRRSQDQGSMRRVVTPLRLSYYEKDIDNASCIPADSYTLTFTPKTADGTTYQEQGGSSGGPIIAFMGDKNPVLFSTVSFAGAITNTLGSNYTIIGQLATSKDSALSYLDDPKNTFTPIDTPDSMLVLEKEFPVVSTTIYIGPIVSTLINQEILALDLSRNEKEILYQATLRLLIIAKQNEANTIKLSLDLSGNLLASVCDSNNQDLSYRYQWPTREWIRRGTNP